MNFLMPEKMKKQYFVELEQYRTLLRSGDLKGAWRYLERAHIIGQYHPISHFGIHFRMLVFAIRVRDRNEFLGQIPRLLVGWIGSLFNRIPVGNTGGANVHILAPMEIPEDFKPLLINADTVSKGLSGFKTKS
ncbi:MAG: DUF3703 domain-containing protein [Leptospiraceae bacterium]|nr:DUF3703 domain-containing protein [Leptospiraceae bacterium]